MSTLAFVLGVLFMATGVAASIALHEIGHLVPAKRFGVRVTQYMVGFGPTMWSRKRGETEYGVKAIPLGGYIRMIGMFPPRPGDEPGTVRASSTGRFSQLVDEARAASLEEVRPGDEHRVFYRLPVHRKVIVMLGGPTMNLLIGVVLLTLLVTVHGVATAQPGAVVASVSQCVVPVTEAGDATTCTDQPETPALAAGILPGDRFVSIAGQPVDDTTDVGTLIRPRVGEAVPIVVERDGQQVTVTATPIRNIVPVLDAEGLPVTDRRRHHPDHRGRLPRRAVGRAGGLRAAAGQRRARHAVGLRQRHRPGPGARARAHGRGVAGRLRRRRARDRQPDVGRRRGARRRRGQHGQVRLPGRPVVR